MAASADTTEGMDYFERLPRRVFTLYLPLAVFLFVLLFPFYWMTTTTFKPDDELYDYARFNPFWVAHPTLSHIEKLFFETSYPSWLINTMVVSVAATAISLFCSVCAAYAIERLRFSGARDRRGAGHWRLPLHHTPQPSCGGRPEQRSGGHRAPLGAPASKRRGAAPVRAAPLLSLVPQPATRSNQQVCGIWQSCAPAGVEPSALLSPPSSFRKPAGAGPTGGSVPEGPA